MSNISGRAKIAVGATITAGMLLSYYYYQKNNAPVSTTITDEQLKDALVEQAKNYGKDDQKYKGIYMYSSATDNVYLRSTDGKIYTAGKLSNCPFLKDPDNTVTAFEITDIYNTFNCKDIPSQFQSQYASQCSEHPSDDVLVMLRSADDFEKSIKDSAVGEVSPSTDICYGTSDSNEYLGNNNFKPAKTFSEFIDKNKGKVGDLIFNLGMFAAVARISLLFAVLTLALPGVFETTGWAQQKNGLMTGQMIAHWVVGKLETSIASAIEKKTSKEAIESAEGNIAKVSEDIAVNVASEMSGIMIGLLSKVLGAISSVLGVIGVAQLLGMLVDCFDFCGINNVNNQLSQILLDKSKKAVDLQFNNGVGYKIMNTEWDVATYNICDFDLDPTMCSQKFSTCKSQKFLKEQKWGDGKINFSGKTEITQEEYCKEINEIFDKYKQEYIDNLKVNIYGQCIKRISNQEMASILQTYFPEYDWSQISGVNVNNYPDDLFPKQDLAKMFSIFLVNQNSFVAEFVKDNFFYFLSFFIVVLMIIVLL